MNNFTEEQRAAIDARGKTIVSASAGSGKTTVMIEKIVRLIISGTDVKEILAVTFTKKAAAQMKEMFFRSICPTMEVPAKIFSLREIHLKMFLPVWELTA